MEERQIPNPKSEILANALVGGTGLGPMPPGIEPPEGMATVVLYVPEDQIAGKGPLEIQKDLGIPWNLNNGDKHWFF